MYIHALSNRRILWGKERCIFTLNLLLPTPPLLIPTPKSPGGTMTNEMVYMQQSFVTMTQHPCSDWLFIQQIPTSSLALQGQSFVNHPHRLTCFSYTVIFVYKKNKRAKRPWIAHLSIKAKTQTFNFEIWVTFDQGQRMTSTFDTHSTSLTHLAECFKQLWDLRLQLVPKNK